MRCCPRWPKGRWTIPSDAGGAGRARLVLTLLSERFAVCRLEADAPVPEWPPGSLWSVTRTETELSVVCREGSVPAGVRHQGGWTCLAVQGPLEFDETGILEALAAPLDAAGVPIFALSTFDTDYLLVPGDRLEEALGALRAAGHEVRA